jgi:hypothetical protein
MKKWFEIEVKAAEKFKGSKISEEMKWAVAKLTRRIFLADKYTGEGSVTACKSETDALLKSQKITPAECSYIIGKLIAKARRMDADRKATKAQGKAQADFQKAYSLLTSAGMVVTPGQPTQALTFEQMMAALPRK